MSALRLSGRAAFPLLHAAVLMAAALALSASQSTHAAAEAAIEKVKPSVVAVGTLQKTRSPQFAFRGTGFVIGDGTVIATNLHVVPTSLDGEKRETLVIVIPGAGREVQWREVRQIASDEVHDLALLKLSGEALPALRLGNGPQVQEGHALLLTGFPIGTVLGVIAATHRAMVAAITPVAIPSARANQLDARVLRRLATDPYPVLQLDANAYPGNSGSPLYDPETAEVVGIINMVLVKNMRESALLQPSGITYAIPVRHLVDLLRSAQP